MILGKNTNRQKQYQQNCYTREEFYKILHDSGFEWNSCISSSQKEYFTDYRIKGDSLDFTLYYIFYPLPLIKEIFIKNWAGGWESDQSLIHIEYWDDKWTMRRVLNFKKKQNSRRYR